MSEDSLELRLQLKLPFENICEFDKGLILNITNEYELGVYNFGSFDYIIAGDISLNSAESFNFALSKTLLKYSKIGITHYLDISQPFDPIFKKREKIMILNRELNKKTLGDFYYNHSIISQFQENGFKIIEGKTEGDIVIGFDEHSAPIEYLAKFDPFLKYDLYFLDSSNYEDFE